MGFLFSSRSSNLASFLFLVLFGFLFFSLPSQAFEEGFEDDFESQFEPTNQRKEKKEEVKLETTTTQHQDDSIDLMEDEFDDEEFIIPSRSTEKTGEKKKETFQKSEPSQNQQPKKPTIERPKTEQEWIAFFFYDLVIFAIAIVYIIVYFIGGAVNRSVAVNFSKEFAPLFKQKFALLGESIYRMAASSGVPDEKAVVRLSATQYSILGTGHRSCAGILATINLISRQDMFWWTLGFFTDEKDSVCIEVPMRDLEAMNCLMIRKAYKEEYVQEFQDATQAAQLECPEMGKEFEMLSDCDDAFMTALFANQRTASVLRKHRELVKSIHVTNEKAKSTHKNILRFVFWLPKGDVRELRPLIELAFALIEVMARFTFPKGVLQSIEKKRVRTAMSETREKRQEQLLQKKEEQWSKLTEDQKKKKLEREKMRKMKKRAGAMKVMQVG